MKLLLSVAAILLPLACKLVVPSVHESCTDTARSDCPNCLTLVHANSAIVPPPALVQPPENDIDGLPVELPDLRPFRETLRTPQRAPPAA